MANGETLANLRARALDYADMTGSSFAVDARVTNYINTALRELQDVLINAGYGDYLLSTSTINLVGGTEAYSLPSDFYRAYHVYYLSPSNSRRYSVPKWTLSNSDGFRPSPIGSGTCELWYAPQLTRLSDDADTVHLSVPVAWEDYAAICAAIKLLIREESNPSALMGERERLWAHIKEHAEPRDMGSPGKVEDVYGRWNYAEQYYPEARHLMYRIMGDDIRFIESESQGV